MGGYGSGRRLGYSAKTTTEDCWALDVNWMTREGMFDGNGWRSGSIGWTDPCSGERLSSIGFEVNVPQRWLRLYYRLTQDDESFDYKVPLASSALPWGGVRWWFICALTCNGRYCGRRVGKLYLPPGGRYYGCRHCYDLTYKSCQESRRPGGIWGRMGDAFGVSAGDMKRIWDDDLKWERWIERQEKRNEQRRRRRKARNWA